MRGEGRSESQTWGQDIKKETLRLVQCLVDRGERVGRWGHIETYRDIFLGRAHGWGFIGCRKSQLVPFRQKPLFFKNGHGTSLLGDSFFSLPVVLVRIIAFACFYSPTPSKQIWARDRAFSYLLE
jgi:hypothetical protein